MNLILGTIFLFVICLSTNFALQINLYTSIGQIKQEVTVNNGYFETYLTNEEYNNIIPGTIDFSGIKVLEQDLYSSNEQLRNIAVNIRFNECEDEFKYGYTLIDPYRLLVKDGSSRYSYVSREQIQFRKDPLMNGMILSVKLEDTSIYKVNISYLTRGLRWAPRYEVNILSEESATLRALADIHNEHERAYEITHSQLITGTVPLATSSVPNHPRAEYMLGAMADSSSAISSRPDATNFGTYSYNITRQFNLYPKSIKTYPFITPSIVFNYTLETATYVGSGTSTGLFQRVFKIQSSEFLPAGIATFYLKKTGTCLGQGRINDAAKKSEQKFQLGTDPDVEYTIKTLVKATRYSHPYGQDSDVTVNISNRKESQTVTVTLTINSGYVNTVLTIRNSSSSSITVSQDPTNKSLIIRATIKPNKEESCSFALKQTQ